jgi:site-specific DNA-adenine methylase
VNSATPLQAPFPYFGGKSRVAAEIWKRFGDVQNYVEPFFGSGAVLLARPTPFSGPETVNDADGFLVNFWRAIKAAPDEVAEWADWPVSEADLHARHYWLITEGRNRLARILGDPDGYDAKIAGWWVWGLCCWIGGGWCSGNGPWQWTGDEWVKNDAGQGINRTRPHLGDAGQGINRQRPHLWQGRGINRQRPQSGAQDRRQWITDWFNALAARLRDVRITHGDWSRVLGDSVTWRHGKTAVFLDPPYSNDERADGLYNHDDGSVAALAREWAIEAGKNPDMLICLAGYDTEHEMPEDWSVYRWKAHGGLGNQGNGRGKQNAGRETLWFSPACARPEQESLL